MSQPTKVEPKLNCIKLCQQLFKKAQTAKQTQEKIRWEVLLHTPLASIDFHQMIS